jgi:LysM repeat protein/ABC-type branched-subunit amino acid transport system substrate-binding protein
MLIKSLSKFIFFPGLLLIFFQATTAQVPVVRSENKVIIEGKVFYVHTVKPGQTLYSISKAYDVSETEITKENPGADVSLNVGQVLKISVQLNNAASQPVNNPDDSTYLRYAVKQGETMYSIAKSNNISIEELEKINPLVINHQIQIGQVILVPRNKTESVPQEYTIHRVRRKETIYGIARMYNISEDLLIQDNPELLKKSPRPGQNLKIPPPVISATKIVSPVFEAPDSIAEFIVQKYDTVKIASNYSYYLDSLPDISGRAFNVAFLIPFNYRPAEEISPVEVQQKTKDDIINLDQESNPNDQMLSSRNFLEFMEGSLLAIDSLRNEGISVNVFVYDTRKSPSRTHEIINSPDFKKMDLIIGPFYSYNVEIVSQFSREYQIPMVSPLSGEIGPVTVNPFFFQINPGYKSEFDRMADYVSRIKDKNIVFIHGIDSLELNKFNYLKENFLSRLFLQSPLDSVFIKEIVIDPLSKINLSQELHTVLSKDSDNLVVVPEANEAFVSTVVTQLYFQLKNYNISVLGMPHWSTFQNIDFLYFHKLSLTYLTPYYFSYNDPSVKHFLKDYRKTYYSEPVTLNKKGGSYAFLGYDLSYYFLKIMNEHSRRFILHLDDSNGYELMNSFKFVPVGGNGGFENRSLMLVKFHDNLEISAEPYEIAIPVDISLFQE